MKRHLKTHGRRKIGSAKPGLQNYSNSDVIITKVEDNENSNEASDASNESRKMDTEASVSSLQFDQDPLDTTRDGNTLYVYFLFLALIVVLICIII